MSAVIPWASHVTASSLPPPWATEAVDRLICALDAQDLSTAIIIARVKRAFPSLGMSVITADIVERRLRVLDQWIHVDYFKRGLGVTLSGIPLENGLQGSIGVRHGKAIHLGCGESWEIADSQGNKGDTSAINLPPSLSGNDNWDAKTTLDILPRTKLSVQLPTITLNGIITPVETEHATTTQHAAQPPAAARRNSTTAVAKAKAMVKEMARPKPIDKSEGVGRREAHVRRRRVGGMAPPAALLAKR